MSESPLDGLKLEERFFANVDADLLSKLREELAEEQNAEAIMKTTGIDSKEVAEELAKLKITPETLAAFRLLPLVAVAWADDRVEENERFVITKAAEDSGIEAESAAMRLLEGWTKQRPPSDFLDAWCDYTKALIGMLSSDQAAELKRVMVEQANAVAEASGGFYGYGAKSDGEKAVISKIEGVF